MSETKLDFEKSVKRLEEIAEILECGTVSLEESMKLYDEGSKLFEFCNDCLNKAEFKFSTVNEGN